jgi:hypothetical protein
MKERTEEKGSKFRKRAYKLIIRHEDKLEINIIRYSMIRKPVHSLHGTEKASLTCDKCDRMAYTLMKHISRVNHQGQRSRSPKQTKQL